MIHNLYIISEGGVAIYTKNFAKSLMDEQLISGFLLAVGNFAKEALGTSGLRKIELYSGEQLFVYYDYSTKLTAAAITSAQDHPKLVSDILPEILAFFSKHFGDKIHGPHIVEEATKFDPIVEELLAEKTAQRNKKRLFLGLVLGAVVLSVIFILLLPYLAIVFQKTQQQIDYILKNFAGDEAILLTIVVFGGFSFSLELAIIILFIPSSLVAGYLAGSRRRGKWIGVIFFFFATIYTIIVGIFIVTMLILTLVIVIFTPLVLITSVALGYLGGLLRDHRKLYPIPSEIQLGKKVK